MSAPGDLIVEKLDPQPDLDCPRCGVRESYPWSVEGLDGYIDSCDECAQYVARDTLELHGGA